MVAGPKTAPPTQMDAWVVDDPGPVATHPPLRIRREVPEPAPDELLVRVLACGVCRTDLHVAEGDLPARRPRVVLGHEVVGTVVGVGSELSEDHIGRRVGIAWLRRTCGRCRWCRRGAENLCPQSRYTGWDADGGYAEYAVVPIAFSYDLPERLDPLHAAPLLCAGIIGYRALRRSALPPAGRLGIYGFGASAHITAQVALAQGAEVHVLTRGEGARTLARELGAASVGGAYDSPPVPLDSAILFAPAGELVPVALSALNRGGTLALAGIHVSQVPPLDYQRHLFQERALVSVTSNTRADGEDLLALASRTPLRMSVTPYPMARADQALADLAAGRVTGAAVLTTNGPQKDEPVRSG